MKRINYLLFVLVLFISFSTITYAKEQEAYIPCELASDGLKIRDINDINNAVGGLSCGTSIKVIEKDVKSDATCSKWYKIKYNNKEYYSCGEYIYIVEDVKMYKEYLKGLGFPDSYLDSLVQLHEKYPNWNFEVFNSSIAFDKMADIEYDKDGKSLFWDKYGNYDGYKSTDSWSYNYLTDKFRNDFVSGGYNWYAPSYNTITYYMDPRNFLDEKHIFMFETLGYNSSYHTSSGVEKMLKGTFMEGKYADSANNKTYVDAFIDSAKQNNVSPYVLIARVVQEVGSGGSTIVSGTVPGYEGYYNFYNIGSTGAPDEIITNGLKYAKSKGWDTPYKAIVGGATFLSNEYINVGQDTLYLQKWDLFGSKYGNHQYQQNIQAPSTESVTNYNGYANSSLLDNAFTFKIPVFSGIPEKTKLDNKGNPNNYLSSLKINDTYLFKTATHTTTFNVEFPESVTSASISATKVNNKAIVNGTGTVALSGASQSIVISVIAENGALRDYVINVKRNVKEIEPTEPDTPTPTPSGETDINKLLTSLGIKYEGEYIYGFAIGTKIEDIVNNIKNANKDNTVLAYNKDGNITSGIITSGDKITIKSSTEEKTFIIVLKGDVNGDGKISAVDYVLIKNHIMNTNTLNSQELLFADVNKDGKVSAVDYVLIKNHIMEISKIVQ